MRNWTFENQLVAGVCGSPQKGTGLQNHPSWLYPSVLTGEVTHT